jgi:hypothetical protein
MAYRMARQRLTLAVTGQVDTLVFNPRYSSTVPSHLRLRIVNPSKSATPTLTSVTVLYPGPPT